MILPEGTGCRRWPASSAGSGRTRPSQQPTVAELTPVSARRAIQQRSSERVFRSRRSTAVRSTTARHLIAVARRSAGPVDQPGVPVDPGSGDATGSGTPTSPAAWANGPCSQRWISRSAPAGGPAVHHRPPDGPPRAQDRVVRASHPANEDPSCRSPTRPLTTSPRPETPHPDCSRYGSTPSVLPWPTRFSGRDTRRSVGDALAPPKNPSHTICIVPRPHSAQGSG